MRAWSDSGSDLPGSDRQPEDDCSNPFSFREFLKSRPGGGGANASVGVANVSVGGASASAGGANASVGGACVAGGVAGGGGGVVTTCPRDSYTGGGLAVKTTTSSSTSSTSSSSADDDDIDVGIYHPASVEGQEEGILGNFISTNQTQPTVVEQLQKENERLRSTLQQQSERADRLQVEVSRHQRRDAAETHRLQDAVASVEETLRAMTTRAVIAEKREVKLNLEIQSLKAELQTLRVHHEALEEERRERLTLAADDLHSLGRQADIALRHVLAGVGAAMSLADRIDSLGRIGDHHQGTGDQHRGSGDHH
ncbi:uncharacterized protein LOC144954658 [Lampetra fluviatilis]